MKKKEESGFIIMIVIMIALAVFIIGFAVYRITQANSSIEPARENTQSVLFG